MHYSQILVFLDQQYAFIHFYYTGFHPQDPFDGFHTLDAHVELLSEF